MSFSPDEIAVHREPLWREQANCVLLVPTPDVGGAEQLWAEDLGESRFRLCCIPFFVYGMSLGDTVSKTEDQCVVEERSGFNCFRIWLGSSRYPRESVLEGVRRLPALIERSSSDLYALAVAPGDATSQVVEHLIAESLEDRLIWEVGYSAELGRQRHPLAERQRS